MSPLSPVRGMHVNPIPRSRVDPAAQHASTWKYENVRTVVGDDGKLKVAIEWRRGYRLPHDSFVAPLASAGFDLDHARVC